MLGDSLRRRHAPKPPPSRPTRPSPRPRLRGRFAWWHWLLLALGVLLVSFGIGYLLATQVLFPAPPTAGAGIPVPDLYGRPGAEAERIVRDAGLVPTGAAPLTSQAVPAGRVLAQSPVPGQQLRAGATVRVVLSAGPPSPIVPAVAGLGQSAARELLEAVGFRVEVQQVPSSLPGGTVTRTDPGAGVALPLPAVVTLIVSAGEPPAPGESAGVAGVPWP